MQQRKYITITGDKVILNENLNPKLQLAFLVVIAIFVGLQAWFWYENSGADILFWILLVITALLLYALGYSISKNSLNTTFQKSEISHLVTRKKINGRVLILKLNNGKQKALHLGPEKEVDQAISIFRDEGIRIDN